MTSVTKLTAGECRIGAKMTEKELVEKTNEIWKLCIGKDKVKDVAWFVIKWCIEHKDLL